LYIQRPGAANEVTRKREHYLVPLIVASLYALQKDFISVEMSQGYSESREHTNPHAEVDSSRAAPTAVFSHWLG